MTHGSLFSGIGGFDLAAEWMGWENVFHCEYDPFCQKVLKHHFPNSKLYEDIKTFDASNYAGRIDILTGGFPCQPFSNAGLRKGTEDDRHLFPQMLRIIKEISPRYIVGENVRGLLNWSGGLVFEEVCADLENEGYEVTPFILPAAGKNAPHRRDRIWFVAKNTDKNGRGSNKREEESNIRRFGDISARNNVGVPSNNAEVRTNSDTDSVRLQIPTKGRNFQKGTNSPQKERGKFTKGIEANGRKWRASTTPKNKTIHRPSQDFWKNFPTQPPICGGDDGLPKELDGITFPKWRKESIKAYGNAIVPQVAYEIFKAIQKMEESVVS